MKENGHSPIEVEAKCPACEALAAKRERGGPWGPYRSVCDQCQAHKARERDRRYKQSIRRNYVAGRLPKRWLTLVEVAQLMRMDPRDVMNLQARAMAKLRIQSEVIGLYDFMIGQWLAAVALLRKEGLLQEAAELEDTIAPFRECVWELSIEIEQPVAQSNFQVPQELIAVADIAATTLA